MVDRLLPFASHYLSLGGQRLHYLDEGAGAPVVMLHGNPTWCFYYRSLVSTLRDRYRTIVPDHIGCGLSDKPDDSQYSYRLESRVRDLEALLEHLELRENLTLVLHDWGGMIGMAFAQRHPERIARLVILNTGAFRRPSSKPFPWPLWICRNTPLGPLLVRGLNAFSVVASYICCQRHPMQPSIRRAFLAPYDSWHNRIAVLRFVEDIPLAETDPSYELVKQVEKDLDRFRSVPILICWGMRDFVFDEHFLAEWRRRFPRAEVHSFPDAGHYVLEDAAAEIIPLVEHFLTEHPLAVGAGP